MRKDAAAGKIHFRIWIISVDVYGDNANIIPDEIPELLDFMDEVLPKESEENDDMLLAIVADTSNYLEV